MIQRWRKERINVLINKQIHNRGRGGHVSVYQNCHVLHRGTDMKDLWHGPEKIEKVKVPRQKPKHRRGTRE